ncbi:MAG: cupredoxin domain-containing protein [Candidatus Acidiferrales bacterium]
MRRDLRILILCVVAAIAFTGMEWESRVWAAQDQNTQVIEMTAKKYEFSPSVLHVKAGAKILLKITATDRSHGFAIPTVPDGSPKGRATGLVLSQPARNNCYRLEKGQQVSVEIEAKTPGTYTFKCCVHCGLGHGKMKGELVVDP